MTTLRFDFQRDCVTRALADLPGVAINCGANDDPANLKDVDPGRVVNCDLFDRDEVLGRPNRVDAVFDCARDRWPFDDRSAAIVVLGDIVEHLTPAEIDATLAEARRVAARLCVTVPRDERETTSPEQAAKHPRGAVHQTVVTEMMLRDALDRAGWTAYEFQTVDYFFVPVGYFVEAD